MFVDLQFLILVRAASNFTQKLPAEFTNVGTLLEELQLAAFTVTVSLEALTECWVSVLLRKLAAVFAIVPLLEALEAGAIGPKRIQ